MTEPEIEAVIKEFTSKRTYHVWALDMPDGQSMRVPFEVEDGYARISTEHMNTLLESGGWHAE